MLMAETIWVQRSDAATASCGTLDYRRISDRPARNRNDREGLGAFLLLHTSAALALNESVEPEVRQDLESFINTLALDSRTLYAHAYEGPDDMPAHIKSVLVGAQLTLPVSQGAVNWKRGQGVYLCEFRRGGARRAFVTSTEHPVLEQFGD